MLKYKTYVKTLSVIFIGILGSAFIYICIYSKTYPIPIFHRISLDAKMMFIRDMKNREGVDTVIVGSSIGLNNIQGIVLEESSKNVKHVLNMSALGLKTTQVEQLIQLLSLFPNIKRVIYSVQFWDFSDPLILEDYDPDFIKGYIEQGAGYNNIIYNLYGYKHLFEFVKHHWKWKKTYMPHNTNHCIDFDRTGSVVLRIYGKDINHKRFFQPHGTHQSEENYLSLERIAKKLKNDGIQFYLIAQPYRKPLLQKNANLLKAMKDFWNKTENIVVKNGGKFLNLHNKLLLGDQYFADRSHLNDEGSVLTSKAIGEFIDKTK
jgi:hypothetical protein